MSRARSISVLVLIAVFAIGIVAGLGIAPLLRPPPPGDLPPGLAELGLSRDQRARVAAIVDRHRGEIDAALGDALPRLRAVQESVALEIEQVLDADQREEFRQMRARRSAPPPR